MHYTRQQFPLYRTGKIVEKFRVDAYEKKTKHLMFSRHETLVMFKFTHKWTRLIFFSKFRIGKLNTLSVRATIQAVDEPLAFVLE